MNQCKKAGRKLSALTRICKFMSLERRRTLMKAFIESQLGYCLPTYLDVLWKKLNNRTNHFHEKALRVVYNINQSSFGHLLRLDCSVPIHHRNSHLFTIEIYEIKNNISTAIMFELFEKLNLKYDLCSQVFHCIL